MRNKAPEINAGEKVSAHWWNITFHNIRFNFTALTPLLIRSEEYLRLKELFRDKNRHTLFWTWRRLSQRIRSQTACSHSSKGSTDKRLSTTNTKQASEIKIFQNKRIKIKKGTILVFALKSFFVDALARCAPGVSLGTSLVSCVYAPLSVCNWHSEESHDHQSWVLFVKFKTGQK